ncbi:TPA: hypothetical protein DCE37_19745 [Candidatus Latescibacteria bacterium]|nr:hypothetical protein [Candidatus Latescibacterota bacterium]|tara:strand:- start:216 stop:881 length:666 start_codon:yes stop_codon:yes gene_type:complete
MPEPIPINPKQGYDLWAPTYDNTPNPVVALDSRHTISHLAPQPGEHILDAGYGTGRNIQPLLDAGAIPTGVDFSDGMLSVAKQRHPDVSFTVSSLDQLPDDWSDFDAVLCALLGEHLSSIDPVFASLHRVTKPGGRLVFSFYHPWMAEAGIEANFTLAEKEYRLGAETHSIDDYAKSIADAGYTDVTTTVYDVDDELVSRVQKAEKYLGKPILVVLCTTQP